MNIKASKSGKEKYESKLLRSLLRHWLSRSFIVAFGLNKKVSCEGTFNGGGDLKYFATSIYQCLCRFRQ